jgi:para-nitrobenzyl esterase
MKSTILFILISLSCLATWGSADLVNIDGLGVLQGHVNGDIREYLGIPYAEPPVGPNRFKAPIPVKPWSKPFAANQKIACIQSIPTIGLIQQEDCLVVNVWRPFNYYDYKDKLPVLVYIHGGGFKLSSGLEHYMNATRYAKEEGMVVVSFNYRLDALSYFAHKALSEEDPLHPTNFGLLDQRLALSWVYKYISIFHGDPNRITVMGESAGAHSILAHLRAHKEHKPVFKNAIILSSAPTSTMVTLDQAEHIGEEMIKEVGCDLPSNKEIMECLRALPAEELMFNRQLRWQALGANWRDANYLVNDGVNFKWTSIVFFEGKYDLKVPILIGSTADEGTLFSTMGFPSKSISEVLFTKMIQKFVSYYEKLLLKETTDQLWTTYSTKNPQFSNISDPYHWIYSALISDYYFICPTQQLIKSLSKHQPIYGYVFNYSPDPNSKFRAHHGIDLMYAFGADAITGRVSHNDRERKFANDIVKYFATFAKTGIPGGANLPAWPIYGPTGKLMSLEPEMKVIEHYKEEVCAFWEQNFPSGIAYTGADYFSDEEFSSKLINKYPFVALFFLWRKRRFAKPVLALLSILTVLFWYKVITKCCCRNKNTKKSNHNKDTKSKTSEKQKAQ